MLILVVAVPDDWIDVQTIADLEEVAFDIRSKRNTRLRVATKYPNLTNDFLISKGVTQYKIISSLGATETYPFIGSSEIITDITSSGKTLADNNLRVLKDGKILNSTACLFFAKKKAARLQPFLNSLIRLKLHSHTTHTAHSTHTTRRHCWAKHLFPQVYLRS